MSPFTSCSPTLLGGGSEDPLDRSFVSAWEPIAHPEKTTYMATWLLGMFGRKEAVKRMNKTRNSLTNHTKTYPSCIQGSDTEFDLLFSAGYERLQQDEIGHGCYKKMWVKGPFSP